MIYEIETYDCRPGRLQALIARLESVYMIRAKYSLAIGSWFTDIGPLHQLVQIWSYQSRDNQLEIRAEASRNAYWKPNIQDLIVNMHSEVFEPVSFCPQPEQGSRGPIYEMRTYTIRSGTFSELEKIWMTVLEQRVILSPLLLALISRNGSQERFIHIWPYKSLNHRAQIRTEAEAKGIWPPKDGRRLSLKQETKILLATPFSPLR